MSDNSSYDEFKKQTRKVSKALHILSEKLEPLKEQSDVLKQLIKSLELSISLPLIEKYGLDGEIPENEMNAIYKGWFEVELYLFVAEKEGLSAEEQITDIKYIIHRTIESYK